MSARDDLAERILAILGGGNAGSRTEWAASMLANWDDAARIALARALVPPGWVVVRDCGDAPHIPTGRDEHTPDYADGHADGWEQARDAILASGEETP